MNAVTQLHDRRLGIGASEAPVILGLSPWRTRIELWMEKMGHGSPQAETLPMRVGTALEPVVLQAFTDETGLPVTDRQVRFIDQHRPWRWATVDGLAGNALVEAKTSSSSEEWGEAGTDQVPPYYVAQVQHALACTELELAYVPVLFAARDFRIYEIRRDDAIIEAITAAETEFWAYVQSGEAPPLQSPAEARIRWPQDTGASTIAPPEIELLCGELADTQAQAKSLDERVDALKAEIQAYMAEAATLVSPDGRAIATWKTAKAPMRLDGDLLKKDYPEAWANCRTPGTASRRFLLKG
jgi:putative phage-type endonuclease